MALAGVEAYTRCSQRQVAPLHLLSICSFVVLLLPAEGVTNTTSTPLAIWSPDPQAEAALTLIDEVATENWGALCSMEKFRSLPVMLPGAARLHDSTRQKADMATSLLRDVGLARGPHGLLDAVAKSLLSAERIHVLAARILSLNATSGILVAVASWRQSRPVATEPPQLDLEGLSLGSRPDSTTLPWFPEKNLLLSPPRFMNTSQIDELGRWTAPYYSCAVRRWIMSYTVVITMQDSQDRFGLSGVLSLDVDLSDLDVNQCSSSEMSPLAAFLGTHKCHANSSTCETTPGRGWVRGAYRCHCKPAFYARPPVFNGSLVEQAWLERETNTSSLYETRFRCLRCAPGCANCTGPEPCLADYNWPFRITLLTVTCVCVLFTLALICYVIKHHKLKVFKVASPTFLSITLLGCAIMYLEMAAIFPVLDMYSCVATKWTRHLGFCITYTALLMKTWRVSLTYRVKSAHKVKLTDKQLLQWMFPILLVMLIYLGTWTLSAPPMAEDIRDRAGLRFKQCTYNWWDHSLAIGEVLFLAWGIRVCYNVRNAESLYNEAKLISYAIYNIAAVNIAMVAFHLLIFPRAGPDIKYLLGFIRTQMSTSVTVALVFGPKVYRVLRGHGDQYDSRARARGVTASFSLNGIGLVPEEPPDLYQENEELKEEIQKLAAQIEFMRIVHMEMNNRHLKPKPGGYFSASAASGGKSYSSRSEPSDVSCGIPSDIAGSSAGAVASTSALGDRL